MTTITDQSSSKKTKVGGYTLVEAVISMALLSLVVSMGLSSVTFISQSTTALTNYSIMSSESRHALEQFARDIRMGYMVNSATASKLDFSIYGKAGTTSNIVYEYSDSEDILYRTENGGTTEKIVEDLTAFQLNYFDLRKDPTTAPISIKEVQIEGVMRKKALVLTNTNYIISARFMMRNRSVSN